MRSTILRSILALVVGLGVMSLPAPSRAAGPQLADGYWIVDEAGAIHSFGGAPEYAPVVGEPVDMASGEDDALWILASNGVVHTRGPASNFGDLDASLLPDGETLIGITPTATGGGYWIATSSGRVVAFGDAQSHDGLRSLQLDASVVDIAIAGDGVGHYLVGADGGVFAQVGAPYLGSRREVLSAAAAGDDVVAAVADPDGSGYWLVADDGGLFAFGAEFVGSVPMVLGGARLDAPVVDAIAYGAGVMMLARDGGVFVFSDLGFWGSAKGASEFPAVAIADSRPSTEVSAETINLVTTLELGAGSWQPGTGFGRLWVPNRDEDTLTVLDAETFELIDVIDVGDRPFPARITPHWVWVPNVGDGTLSVIDPVSLETVATIATGDEPRTPQMVDFKMFVAHRASNKVVVINEFTLQILDEIEVAEGSQAAMVDPIERLLWVPNTGGATVTVIDTQLHQEVNRVAVGAAPFSPTKAYGRVWVPNRDSQSITVIDPETYGQVATLDVGMQPSRPLAAFDKLFVGGVDSDDLLIIDPVDLSISRVAMEAGSLMPSVGHDVIWVANRDARKVSVVDPESFEVLATIEVEGRPRRPVIRGDYVFISTIEGNVSIYKIG